jgi:hypothetical protein
MLNISEQLSSKVIIAYSSKKSKAQIQFFLGNTQFITIDLEKPQAMSDARYTEMNTPGNHQLVFCESNGSVLIARNSDDNVYFEFSRFGCGSDSRIKIKMPANVCEPVFAALAEWRRKYE